MRRSAIAGVERAGTNAARRYPFHPTPSSMPKGSLRLSAPARDDGCMPEVFVFIPSKASARAFCLLSSQVREVKGSKSASSTYKPGCAQHTADTSWICNPTPEIALHAVMLSLYDAVRSPLNPSLTKSVCNKQLQAVCRALVGPGTLSERAHLRSEAFVNERLWLCPDETWTLP